MELSGAGLFGVPLCPGVMFKSTFLQLSPSVAEARSYLSCVYIPLTLIGAVLSVLAILKQVRKKQNEDRHCGQVENKEFSQQQQPQQQKTRLINLNACCCLDLSLNMV